MSTDQDFSQPWHSPLREAWENVSTYLLGDLSYERTGELARYLCVVARFPLLSTYNHHLIFAQCPDAQILATYEEWNSWGYSIQAHAKGRKLWDDSHPLVCFDERQVRARADARPEVFDVFEKQEEEPDNILARLEAILEGEGIAWQDYVTEEMETDAIFHRLVAGWATNLVDDHPFTLAHPGRIADGHIEAITTVVSQQFGFAPMPLMSDIEQWGRSQRALREELEVVRQIACTLIERLEEPGGRPRGRYPHLTRQRQYPLALP